MPNRNIIKPNKPAKGCTCTCRADNNENIPGHIGKFAFVTGSGVSCSDAKNNARILAIKNLGSQPKHLQYKCHSK